jgi:hypothetical protein
MSNGKFSPRLGLAKGQIFIMLQDIEKGKKESSSSFYLNYDPSPHCEVYLSASEHQAILKEERAKVLDEIIIECARKQKLIDMSPIGHSAQSSGQDFAYENIKDFCKAKAASLRQEGKDG